MLLAVAACAGCGSSGSSKVSASKYVSAVCSAISPLEKALVTRSSALNNKTAASATEAKKTLQGFLTAVEQDSSRALNKIQSAGTPDISGGKAVAATVVRAFTELRDAMRVALTKSNSLPTDSPTSFKTAAQSLGASVRASLNNIDQSGLTNPDLEKAAANEAACRSLSNR
jgi:mevalonate kinase